MARNGGETIVVDERFERNSKLIGLFFSLEYSIVVSETLNSMSRKI